PATACDGEMNERFRSTCGRPSTPPQFLQPYLRYVDAWLIRLCNRHGSSGWPKLAGSAQRPPSAGFRRLELEPDGTLDPVKADLAWSRRTDPAQQRAQSKARSGARTGGAKGPGDNQAGSCGSR